MTRRAPALLLAALLLVALGGCRSASTAPTVVVEASALRYLIEELCHERARLLRVLPASERSEQDVVQQRRWRELGQEGYYQACRRSYLDAYGQP